jgi:predicted transcriptional regulator of viral defense system
MDLTMATKGLSRGAVRAEREYVTVDEAEQLSAVSKWFWRRAAYSGAIESVKVGRRLIIPLAEVQRVLAEGKRPRLPGASFFQAKTA